MVIDFDFCQMGFLSYVCVFSLQYFIVNLSFAECFGSSFSSSIDLYYFTFCQSRCQCIVGGPSALALSNFSFCLTSLLSLPFSVLQVRREQ